MSYYYRKDYGKKTPLKRAKHMGSARSGTHHWWTGKLSSVFVLPLLLWLGASMMHLLLAQNGFEQAYEFVTNPFSILLFAMLFCVYFYHVSLFVEEVILDYVKTKWTKVPALLLVQTACALAAVIGIYGILVIVFGIAV